VGDVIFADFGKYKSDGVWALYEEITLNGQSGYVMTRKCPHDNYDDIIGRRVKELVAKDEAYILTLDGDAVEAFV
tara:strand:+ start:242 stop:466 length:225 start_codon:yes stop_codon:yes gene_type:complete